MSVLDILRSSGLGTLEQLPNTLCADYIFVPGGHDKMCIPFKHVIETVAGSKTKYGPYFVSDNKLADFMSGLYDAVVSKTSTYKWPSGIEVDISSIKLQDFEEASIPKSYLSKKEYENQKWRREMFPMLDYVEVDVENTTVDMIINGLRVQDKTANIKKRLEINLKKAGGRKNKKVTYQPYEQDDFDLLWIFPNNSRRYMFLIPMEVLVNKGLIRTPTQKGQTFLHCVDKSNESSTSKYAWTRDYCFDTEAKNIQQLVAEFISKIRCG